MYIKARLNPFFIWTRQTGLPRERPRGDFPWRMSRCSCTHFVPSACCTEDIAWIWEGRGPSCSSSGTAACLDEKLRLWCIFILYIFVYINYIAMLGTQILLYLLVSVSYKKKRKKRSITGDIIFFFHRKYACKFLFVCFLGHHLRMAHKGIREEFLEELGEASLCLHETCPIAG